MRLAVDLMGGELPPQAIFEAVLQVASTLPKKITLVAIAESSFIPDLRRQYLSILDSEKFSIEFVSSENSIGMEESPLFAVRRKRNSSIAIGVKLVKDKKCDGFLSTGNTGALFAFSVLSLSPLPSINKPALLVTLPTLEGNVAVLDVGANIAFKSVDLISFAKMGSAYQQIRWGIRKPKIGLLNIGSEEMKGTKEVKEGYRLLQEHFKKDFLGNVEARELFQGKVDVLVTDGFTGNVFLKTCEGTSSFLLDYLKTLSQKKKTEGGLLSSLEKQFNYSEHPGAFFAGLSGLIVKCHGYSNMTALITGIQGAIQLIESKLIKKMTEKLS